MGVKLTFIALAVCIVPAALGQTFQYSRGWTNGKRNGLQSKDTACELHRIKAVLEGKPLTPFFWPCGYRQFQESNGRLLNPTVIDLSKIPSDTDEKK